MGTALGTAQSPGRLDIDDPKGVGVDGIPKGLASRKNRGAVRRGQESGIWSDPLGKSGLPFCVDFVGAHCTSGKSKTKRHGV